MARIAGRNGRLYVNIASGGTAEPIAFLNKFAITFTVPQIDVTAFGDANTTFVAGFRDCKGTYGGFYDTATAQLYTAATDGVARKFYLYPDTTGSQYWHGTAIFDFNVDEDVAGAVAISGNFAANSDVFKV